MKTLIENWNKFVNENEQESEQEQIADILSKFKSIQGDKINAGQLKFLVRLDLGWCVLAASLLPM